MTYRECIRQNMLKLEFNEGHVANFTKFMVENHIPEEFLDSECSNPDSFWKRMSSVVKEEGRRRQERN
jgi:hypothetical protein